MSKTGFQPTHLTVHYGTRVRVIVTDIGVGLAHTPSHPPTKGFSPFKAIWDTGASGSVITQKVVSAVGLAPTGVTRTRGVHGVNDANVYLVGIHIPTCDVTFHALRVTEGDLGEDAQILIGMDVISMGDFAVTNCEGKTTFSFRLPSMERIDFSTHRAPKPVPIVHSSPQPGPNDLCPCGSGKKYKKCCRR